MATPRILVTPRSLTRDAHRSIDLLRDAGYDVLMPTPGRQPTEQELLAAVPDCVGYLAGVEPITANVIAAATNLRAISRNGVGIDSIDEKAAQAAGVRILTAPGANANGVAELAIGLIYALARALPANDRTIRAGGWERFRGVELRSTTLGIVGCGSVGRLVAQAAIGIGMKVVGYDPYPFVDFTPEGFAWAGLDDIFRLSRFVTLHCPPSESPVVTSRVLSEMPDGSYLVNTARAGLVEPEAILEALESGKLAGYATDVHVDEPPTDRRLVEHERVIATPHIGGYTAESVDRAAVAAAENLMEALEVSTDV